MAFSTTGIMGFSQGVMVMDATAMVLCRDNNIPLRVFDISRAGDLMRMIMGDGTVGTLVDNGGKS